MTINFQVSALNWHSRTLLLGAIAVLTLSSIASEPTTIRFSGYTWVVRPSAKGGPGPNYWDPGNVSVDTNGCLHLRLTHRDGQWYCSEIHTEKRLGFGRYEFWLSGRVDRLDQNAVLGLFNYPTSDVGPDGTHEIDIEFAHWGNPSAPIGNYTVWPTKAGLRQDTRSFPFALQADWSTHAFTWSPTNVVFLSDLGHGDGRSAPLASWVYQPSNAPARISQKTMPIHINLWCFKGRPPTDGQPVEIVVREFKFTPL